MRYHVTQKTWTIGNGWNRINREGQSILIEIGPREFDPTGTLRDYYHQEGSCYRFNRKWAWSAALENLNEAGYAA